MLTNVLEYLEQTVTRLPDKVAFANEEMGLSFCQVYNQARAIGTHLHNEGFYKKPVVVFMKKHPKTIVAFLGTIYSGCYYVPLDAQMPRKRMELILSQLEPGPILCDEANEPLAKELGKEFFDSDEKIGIQTGRHPSVIIREEGEKAFRDREAEAIFSLSTLQGAVIATGGGAVLREENVENLRANGILLFLDAPLDSLQATSDRPLSADPAALARRYEERYEKYCAAAHIRVPVSRDVSANLAAIKKELV